MLAQVRALPGVRGVGLVTNGPADVQRDKIDLLGLWPEIDFAVISGEVGVEKPDPAIFREALRAGNATAADAIYIGDSPEFDMDGARERRHPPDLDEPRRRPMAPQHSRPRNRNPHPHQNPRNPHLAVGAHCHAPGPVAPKRSAGPPVAGFGSETDIGDEMTNLIHRITRHPGADRATPEAIPFA